jgi:hypothetical protein
MMNSDLKLGPDVFSMGNNKLIKNAGLPVPGIED